MTSERGGGGRVPDQNNERAFLVVSFPRVSNVRKAKKTYHCWFKTNNLCVKSVLLIKWTRPPPTVFAYCKRSKTGQWEGLGTRLRIEASSCFESNAWLLAGATTEL